MLKHDHPIQTKLEHARVGDCMHHGILSCPPDTPLPAVAAIMAKHEVHAVAISDDRDGRPVGVLSDLDVIQAAAASPPPPAIEVAATEPLAVSAGESLLRAAQLMSEHGVTHLIVLDATGGYPVGILSTLDVVAVYASARSGEDRL